MPALTALIEAVSVFRVLLLLAVATLISGLVFVMEKGNACLQRAIFCD